MRARQRIAAGQVTALALAVCLLFIASASASGALREWEFKRSFGSAGSAAGQFQLAPHSGLAVNEASENVYIADPGNHRVDEFSSTGTFIRAFGTNVGGPGVSVCTLTCVAGTSTSAAGGFEAPMFVAVDNSGGVGDVYVADTADNLVSKFDAAGNLISTWGNAGGGGSANGQLKGNGTESFSQIVGIAVDSSGNLSVGWGAFPNPGNLFRFTQAGAFVAPAVSVPRGTLQSGLAQGPADHCYKVNGDATLEKFTCSTGADVGQVTQGSEPRPTTGLSIDPSSVDGELFVAFEIRIRYYAFGPSGEVQETSPLCTPASLVGCPSTSTLPEGHLTQAGGLAVNGATHAVYAADFGAGKIAVFDEKGAVPEPVTQSPESVGVTSATLKGTVKPNGELTSCFFEYGENAPAYGKEVLCKEYEAGGVWHTLVSPSELSGSTTFPVRSNVEDLQSGTKYYAQLRAANENNEPGETVAGGDVAFMTHGARIEDEQVSGVTQSTAKISARIDPKGQATQFSVEYLDEAHYLANPPSERFAGASVTSARNIAVTVTGAANLLTGSKVVTHLTTSAGAFGVGQEITGIGIPAGTKIEEELSATELKLSQAATVTEKAVAFSATGPEPVFQILNGLALHTTYHFRIMATNADVAHGPDLAFTTFEAVGPLLPDARAYEMVSPNQKAGEVIPPNARTGLGGCSECLPGENVPTMPMQASPDGTSVLYEGQPFAAGLASGPNEYLSGRGAAAWGSQSLSPAAATGRWVAFSSDLTRGVLYQEGAALSPLAPTRGGHAFANLYLREGGALTPLIGEEPPHRDPGGLTNSFQARYAGADAAFEKVVFEANDALTPGAPEVGPNECSVKECDLYEWSGGGLRLVNLLPGNLAAAREAVIGSGRLLGEAGVEYEAPNTSNAVSDDGTKVFWSSGETGHVYARAGGTETLEVEGPASCKASAPSGSRACFLTASIDGSKVLLANGALNALNASGSAYEEKEDLSAGEGGFEGILGSADDLSRVYFVDTKVLTGAEENANGEAAEENEDNLYLWEEGARKFIGRLEPGDKSFGNNGRYGSWKAAPSDRTAQTSADGSQLAFMSRAPLTGYDNALAGGGECEETHGPTCPEVFEYAAETGALTCASCNPSNQRPLGSSNLTLLKPGGPTTPPFRQPGNLSRDGHGRLFFESQDALSPQDTNGSVQDVYEWEPQGIGSCAKAGGCVYLISSGQNSGPSLFLDSTPSGNDAFLITRQRLLPRDQDSQLDLYDARVGGSFPEEAEASCSGEACRGPVSEAPAQPSPSSSSFVGPGNPKPAKKTQAKKKHAKHKKKKRTAKHSRGGGK